MKKALITLFISFIAVVSIAQDYYPVPAKKEAVIDTFFTDYILVDNYRWLEDVESHETQLWLNEQEKLSSHYLTKAVNKTSSKRSIDKYGTVGFHFPRKMGKYYFTIAYPSTR